MLETYFRQTICIQCYFHEICTGTAFHYFNIFLIAKQEGYNF